MRKKIKILIVSLSILTAGSLSITFGMLFYLNTPSARYGYGMVYDESVNKLVLFGGGYQDSSSSTCYGDMWLYDPVMNIWTEIFPSQHPTARHSHSMIYDSINQKIVLFGGIDINNNWVGDTWIFDSQTTMWTQVFPDNSPSTRGSVSSFYDPQSQRVILFGGYRPVGGHYDDTWAYNYSANSWTNLNPSLKPTGRYGASMVYDPVNRRGFMFGGRTTSITDETWVYYPSNNSWIELNFGIRPSNRYWEGLAYDEYAQRVVLFGGTDGTPVALGDTWIFNPLTNQWTEETPNNNPENRDFFSFVYVPQIRKAILFGGALYGETFFTDTWAFQCNSHTWTQLK